MNTWNQGSAEQRLSAETSLGAGPGRKPHVIDKLLKAPADKSESKTLQSDPDMGRPHNVVRCTSR